MCDRPKTRRPNTNFGLLFFESGLIHGRIPRFLPSFLLKDEFFVKNWRINLILVALILFGAVIAGRLFFLQVVRRDFYRAMAQGQQNIFQEVSGSRGDIFLQDQSGNLYTLATNKNITNGYASPLEIEKKEETVKEISKILGLSEKEALEKISKESFYEVLKQRLTESEAQTLKGAKLRGIYLQDRLVRYYPQEKLASQLTGFVGAEEVGQYGVESSYDDVLRGKRSWVRGETGLEGLLLSLARIGGQSGSDLVLTVDYNIQFFAEKLLNASAEKLEFKDGVIIVMDPRTGKILALAGYPNFDPNNYSSEKDLDIFQNSAVQKIFEPGSVFKPFTMAAALEEKKVTPDMTYIDEGILQIGGYRIYNYDGRVWGEQKMASVLEHSINTGAVFAERQLGHKNFLNYAGKFGFFEPTGIDLDGEAYSENKTLKNGREINFATASFGQGIEITPMQLARGFSALVNGGMLVQPYVAEKIVAADGKTREIQSSESEKRVISQEASSKITAMLVSVVEQGYGKAARISGYSVGGKTGTAQVPWSALGISKAGYSDETIQSFAGFAPAFNPRFVILVKLNNPKVKTAEYSAVPIFRDLAKYILDYLQVPPDREQ